MCVSGCKEGCLAWDIRGKVKEAPGLSFCSGSGYVLLFAGIDRLDEVLLSSPGRPFAL